MLRGARVALRDLHLRLYDVLVSEARSACRALALRYPGSDAADAALRAFSEREWPLSVANA